MRRWLLIALGAGSLQAAAIRGTVVENQTGRPLARALVVLEPVSGVAERTASTRTNQFGTFEFSGLPGGAYLMAVSRPGFAPVNYGQKRWRASGIPIVVQAGESKVLNIPLPRFGSIAGTVLDESDVGLPEHDVVAYRVARPLELVARSRSDERGRYRIAGLEPGKYYIRTVARQYEDGGYLPTFYRDTLRADDATSIEVTLDQQTDDINIRPLAGNLLSLSGQIYPPAQVNVTLVSDTGAETTASNASGNFYFNPTSPGQYELYAQGPADPRTGVIQAAYQPMVVNRDRSDIRVELRPLPDVQFVLKDSQGQPVDARMVLVLARRKDLAGTGKTQTLQLAGDRLQFLPGRWDLALAPVPGYFVAGFSGTRSQGGNTGRADGWNEVLLAGASETVHFQLSAMPGAVHGMVTGSSHQPVAGAPVYLEAYDQAARRVKDPQVTRTDAQGQYQFTDLAPGSYRLLSSFDVEVSDTPLESTKAKILRVQQAQDLEQDLDLADGR